MKRLFLIFMAMISIIAVSCSKDNSSQPEQTTTVVVIPNNVVTECSGDAEVYNKLAQRLKECGCISSYSTSPQIIGPYDIKAIYVQRQNVPVSQLKAVEDTLYAEFDLTIKAAYADFLATDFTSYIGTNNFGCGSLEITYRMDNSTKYVMSGYYINPMITATTVYTTDDKTQLLQSFTLMTDRDEQLNRYNIRKAKATLSGLGELDFTAAFDGEELQLTCKAPDYIYAYIFHFKFDSPQSVSNLTMTLTEISGVTQQVNVAYHTEI